MNTSWIPFLVAVLGFAGYWVTARFGKQGERENALIDQLQEETDRLRASVGAYAGDVEALRSEVAALRAECHRLLSRDYLWSLHVTKQNVTITQLGGQPVPLPDELKDGRLA